MLKRKVLFEIKGLGKYFKGDRVSFNGNTNWVLCTKSRRCVCIKKRVKNVKGRKHDITLFVALRDFESNQIKIDPREFTLTDSGEDGLLLELMIEVSS